jgi:hypothetical protein
MSFLWTILLVLVAVVFLIIWLDSRASSDE